MSKILLLALAIAGCSQDQSNQDLFIEIHKCKQAGLRAVGLHNTEGSYAIQCRPHKHKAKN